jgi:hypothetical protein
MANIRVYFNSPLRDVEFELDYIEQMVLTSLAESSYGMHQGFDSGHFNDQSLNEIFLKFRDLGILREYDNRFYLPPQMYLLAQILMHDGEMLGKQFQINFNSAKVDEHVDFKRFVSSKYFNAIFQEFSGQFNNEVEVLLGSIGKNFLEGQSILEQREVNAQFAPIFLEEICKLKNGIAFEVIN